MNITDCQIGMKVRIAHNIEITTRKHSVTLYMQRMCGNIYYIKHIRSNPDCVIIDGYAWAAEDLVSLEAKVVRSQIFHFDPKHLST